MILNANNDAKLKCPTTWSTKPDVLQYEGASSLRPTPSRISDVVTGTRHNVCSSSSSVTILAHEVRKVARQQWHIVLGVPKVHHSHPKYLHSRNMASHVLQRTWALSNETADTSSESANTVCPTDAFHICTSYSALFRHMQALLGHVCPLGVD